VKHRTLLGQANVPGSDQVLKLYRLKDDCLITLSGRGELMSTRKHASEAALGRLPCQMLRQPDRADVLIGGLGMGFTLAAALRATGAQARITVAELVPEIVDWNLGELGEHSGHPLRDARTVVYPGDVADLLRDPARRFDVIALDVDNGPEGFSTPGNGWLYSPAGIACARERLEPDGVLAYWSATPDRPFARRLRDGGLRVSERSVFAHGDKGVRHTLWLCRTG